MIEITNEAYTRLHQKATENGQFSFSIGVSGGGCVGFKYYLDYSTNPSETDIIIDYGKLRLRVDPLSAPYLTGMTLDYVTEGLNEEFRFINPNVTSTCGCGESIGFV